MYQKVHKMGILVRRAKKRVVNNPPPTFRARSHGVTVIKTTRRVLEKSSLLDASAGSGAFLMAGYCLDFSKDSGDIKFPKGGGYSSCSDPKIFGCRRKGRCGGRLNILEVF